MNIQFFSDIHTEYYADRGADWLNKLDPEGVDALLIAGDLGLVKHCYKTVIPILADKYKQIVLVLGNHEYYKKQMLQYMWQTIRKLESKYDNFKVLDNESIEINGITVYGGTMWFSADPLNIIYEKGMNDFSQIRQLRSWVYKNNSDFQYKLKQIDTPDVILTHHLPSYYCIEENYVGDDLNRFYVTEMSKYIIHNKPKVWICGHTHHSIDQIICETQILSNPLGYPDSFNPHFRDKYTVEVNTT